MLCPVCHRVYPDEARFCSADGSPLSADPRTDRELEALAEDMLDEPSRLIGSVLNGRYVLEEPFAEGGVAVVYRARQLALDREVAVKMLKSQSGANAPARAKRFADEARAIARLRHPGCVQVFDFGHTDDGQLFLVMELLHGRTLEERLEGGAIPVAESFRIVAEVLDVLAVAHAEGIVHRDIKPSNIFLEQVGGREIVRVLDFGIAKFANQSTKTSAGVVVGTPMYMSPEQARGRGATAESDLYSLGVVAYECLAGVPPFRAHNGPSLLLKHVQDPPPPLPDHIPRPARELVLAMLQKAPERRPGGAAELRRQLLSLALGAPDLEADTDGERTSAAEDPTAEQTLLAGAPSAERTQVAGSPNVERTQVAGSPNVERTQVAGSPNAERTQVAGPSASAVLVTPATLPSPPDAESTRVLGDGDLAGTRVTEPGAPRTVSSALAAAPARSRAPAALAVAGAFAAGLVGFALLPRPATPPTAEPAPSVVPPVVAAPPTVAPEVGEPRAVAPVVLPPVSIAPVEAPPPDPAIPAEPARARAPRPAAKPSPSPSPKKQVEEARVAGGAKAELRRRLAEVTAAPDDAARLERLASAIQSAIPEASPDVGDRASRLFEMARRVGGGPAMIRAAEELLKQP